MGLSLPILPDQSLGEVLPYDCSGHVHTDTLRLPWESWLQGVQQWRGSVEHLPHLPKQRFPLVFPELEPLCIFDLLVFTPAVSGATLPCSPPGGHCADWRVDAASAKLLGSLLKGGLLGDFFMGITSSPYLLQTFFTVLKISSSNRAASPGIELH